MYIINIKGSVNKFDTFYDAFAGAKRNLNQYIPRIEIWTRHDWETSNRKLTTLIYKKRI